MHRRMLLATTGRILRQLRHDHRTVAMLLVLPTLLLTLLYYMFDAQVARFSAIALIMLGVFPFTIMFLITSIAMLRERNWLFGMTTQGGAQLVVLIAVLNALLGVALGLLASAFARTEFQAVQILPVVAFPQLLLCGLFVPREAMAGWLQAFSPCRWRRRRCAAGRLERSEA